MLFRGKFLSLVYAIASLTAVSTMSFPVLMTSSAIAASTFAVHRPPTEATPEPEPTPSQTEEMATEPPTPTVTKMVANCSAYTASADECGGDSSGITASGSVATEERTIAMDNVPFGTVVRIYGREYVVEDRFGGNYTDRIDIYFESKADALAFGRRQIEVEILA